MGVFRSVLYCGCVNNNLRLISPEFEMLCRLLPVTLLVSHASGTDKRASKSGVTGNALATQIRAAAPMLKIAAFGNYLFIKDNHESIYTSQLNSTVVVCFGFHQNTYLTRVVDLHRSKCTNWHC